MNFSNGFLKYNNRDIQLKIAKIYLLFLPLRMPSIFSFLQSIFGSTANNFVFILHFLGLFFIFYASKGIIKVKDDEISKLLYLFGGIVLWYSFSSLVMSVYIQSRYGSIGNDTSYAAVLRSINFFVHYFMIFFYNKRLFEFLKKEIIIKILDKLLVFLFILGYLQIGVLNFGGIFTEIYNRVNIFNFLTEPFNTGMVTLTGSEGASAGTIIGVFVFPLLFSKLLVKKKNFKNIIIILLWLPILYFTSSATAYILALSSLIGFVYFYFKNMKKDKNLRTRIVSIILSFTTILILGISLYFILPEESRQEINYLTFEKVSDRDNGSTVSRTVPLVVNWRVFMRYPIIGIGNGNQGYYYEEFFPYWAENAVGSDVHIFLERSRNVIMNGALFFPSILSGYGIVGVSLLVGYFFKSEAIVKKNKADLKDFYYIYKIALIPILLTGFQTLFSGDYLILFILSIPYMSKSITINGGGEVERTLTD